MAVQSLEEINEIKHIILDEINEIEKFIRVTKRKTIEPIVLRAVDKLKKLDEFQENPNKICAVIQKLFHKDVAREVRRYCPSEYKRSTSPGDSSSFKMDEIQEVLTHMTDAMQDAFASCKAILDNYNQTEGEERETIKSFIIDVFGGMPKLLIRIEEWKELSTDMAELKIIHDERIKVGKFVKFMLKIQSFYLSKHKVAELADISSKWIRQGVEINEDLMNLAKAIWGTDARFAVIARWFDRQMIRQSKGLSMEPIPGKNLTLVQYDKLILSINDALFIATPEEEAITDHAAETNSSISSL